MHKAPYATHLPNVTMTKLAEKVKRKLNGTVSKILARGQRPIYHVVLKARDRRWSWLEHVLRMPEHRLVPYSPAKLRQT